MREAFLATYEPPRPLKRDPQVLSLVGTGRRDEQTAQQPDIEDIIAGDDGRCLIFALLRHDGPQFPF